MNDVQTINRQLRNAQKFHDAYGRRPESDAYFKELSDILDIPLYRIKCFFEYGHMTPYEDVAV